MSIFIENPIYFRLFFKYFLFELVLSHSDRFYFLPLSLSFKCMAFDSTHQKCVMHAMGLVVNAILGVVALDSLTEWF